jgi:hypothetical protein
MQHAAGSVDDQLTRDLSALVIQDRRIGVHREPAGGPPVSRNHWTAKGHLPLRFPGQNLFSGIKEDMQLSALVN